MVKNYLVFFVFLILSSCQVDNDEIPIALKSFEVSKWPFDFDSAISFIWDDNNKDHYQKISPLFDLYGFKASYGIISGYLNSEKHVLGYKSILSNGHELMSHSHTHFPVESLSNEDIIFELSESKKIINKVFDITPISYVHPNNRTNEFYNLSLNDYYLYSRIYNPTFLDPNFIANSGAGTDYNRFLYIHSLNVETKNWIVIAAHGVDGYGFNPLSYEDLDNFLLYLFKYKKTWVDTYSKIALYNDVRQKVNLNYENNIITFSKMNLDKYKEYFDECILTFSIELNDYSKIKINDNVNLIDSFIKNDKLFITVDLFKDTKFYLKLIK